MVIGKNLKGGPGNRIRTEALTHKETTEVDSVENDGNRLNHTPRIEDDHVGYMKCRWERELYNLRNLP